MMGGPLYMNARRVSDRITKLIGRRWGARLPLHFICEYPKSGGTWLGKMVADVMQLPYPAPAVFPVSFPAVYHNHWLYDAKLPRSIYLYRDGRDVITSYFFHRMRHIARGYEQDRARYDRLFGKGYDPQDSRGLMPKFIENEYQARRNPNWQVHVDSWCPEPRHSNVVYASYEALLEDAVREVRRIVTELQDGQAPDDWRVTMAVEKMSMAKQTGRKAGEEDRSSFIRKGVAGDWRNHFTREAAEVFNRLAGETLVRLGYESDANWVDSVE